MHQVPVTERTNDAHAQARKAAAERMAAHTTLTLRHKTLPAPLSLPTDRAELRRGAPLRG